MVSSHDSPPLSPELEFRRGRHERSASLQDSELSEMLAAVELEEDEEQQVHPGLDIKPLPELPGLAPGEEEIDALLLATETANRPPLTVTRQSNNLGDNHLNSMRGLRPYTTGQPPRESFLPHRRNTISDVPELDNSLRSFRKTINGKKYLPFTSFGVFSLLDLWIKGSKPIADFTIFKNICFEKRLWETHEGHIDKLLQFFGHMVKRVYMLGESARPSSDEFRHTWGPVLDQLPHVQSIESK